MKKNNPPSFVSMGFSPVLLSAIKKAGYQQPTAIQYDTIPNILAGGDILASAETGSGKTAAFVLPLLQKILDQRQQEGSRSAKGAHVRALVLVPTRELVVQIRDEIKKLAQDVRPAIQCLSVYGGVKPDAQMKAVRNGVDVLVATPHRLLELSNSLFFNKVHTLVLDEADRLVSRHFKQEVEAVFKCLPNKRQNLLFTATFPDSIRELARVILKQPVIVKHDHQTEQQIDQHVVTVNHDQKSALLGHLLAENDWRQILVFCSAKKTCDQVALALQEQGVQAVALHGNKAQKERLQALQDFKSGHLRVLIATDVASRGLDIATLDCVINMELPRSPNDYIHRIGRTGRAGKTGQAISLIAHHEYAHFAVIEKRNGLRLEREQVAGFEASDVAPLPPPGKKRKSTGKKAKKKLSKKKRLKQQKLQRPKTVRDGSETARTEAIDVPGAKASRVTHGTPWKKTAKTNPVDSEKEPVNAHIWGKRK